MEHDYLTRIQSFTTNNLPDLDEVVLGALQFLATANIPKLPVTTHRRPLVIGSVNALRTGEIMFAHVDAVFADESSYQQKLHEVTDIDAVYIISASGGKHAVGIAQEVAKLALPVYLVTNASDAKAAQYIEKDHVYVYPRIREPYTYNTSTYMGMLLGPGEESAKDVLAFIEENVIHAIPATFGGCSSFLLLVPPQFAQLRGMFETKFDELFPPEIAGRAFTYEEAKHAKTVVPSLGQCFISFGHENVHFGTDVQRVTIPLPEGAGPVAMLAIGYFVIGHIQKQQPPFFKEHISEYVRLASHMFGYQIHEIVE